MERRASERLTPVYQVHEINEAARDLLESGFADVTVEGEISNLARPGSGHLYFSLKDERASLSCALFKGSRFSVRVPWSEIRNGLHVRVRGRISLYAPRGQYQMILSELADAGEGALAQEYQARLTRLSQEGLFDAAHKKPLPSFPQKIGIITSASGAALHDALTTLARRNPALPIIIYPATVQGKTAPAELIAQLRTANRRNECDLLLLIRGGGSLEDLWAFNDEALVREIITSSIPVISGVGHEVDVTLADFAADLRAPTPTASAEMACPALADIQQNWRQRLQKIETGALRHFAHLHQRLHHLTHRLQQQNPQRQLHSHWQHCDELHQRLNHTILQTLKLKNQKLETFRQFSRLRAPNARIASEKSRIDNLRQQLDRACQHAVTQKQQQLRYLCHTLELLSPLTTLSRGYGIVQDAQGEVLHSAMDVSPQSTLRIRLHQGTLFAKVTRRHK